MPISDFQDHDMSISNRNCELRTALFFGDTPTIAKVCFHVRQGTAALTSFSFLRQWKAQRGQHFFLRWIQQVRSDDVCLRIPVVRFHFRLGTKSERSQERFARFSSSGGVEPGTTVSCPNVVEEVAADVLSSFMFELTVLDSSDNDFLSRLAFRHHVIWRVGCKVPQTVLFVSTSRSSTHNGRFNLLA